MGFDFGLQVLRYANNSDFSILSFVAIINFVVQPICQIWSPTSFECRKRSVQQFSSQLPVIRSCPRWRESDMRVNVSRKPRSERCQWRYETKAMKANSAWMVLTYYCIYTPQLEKHGSLEEPYIRMQNSQLETGISLLIKTSMPEGAELRECLAHCFLF